MRIAAIIAGLLTAALGGGCLVMTGGWGHWLIGLLGFGPLVVGGGLAIYAITHKGGQQFPLPVKALTWVAWVFVVVAIAGVLFVMFPPEGFRFAG